MQKAILNILLLLLGISFGISEAEAAFSNWSSMGPSGTSVTTVAIDPTAPQKVYAGVFGGGIQVSANSGASWTPASTQPTNTQIYSLAIDQATPGTLLVGTGAGVFKSIDSGQTWSPDSANLPTTTPIRGLAIDPVSSLNAYAAATGFDVYHNVSTGGPLNWSVVGTATLGNKNLNFLAMDPVTPANLYAATAGGIYVSSDGGITWALGTGTSGLNMTTVSVSPSNPAILLAGTSTGGVYKSSNSGLTWSLMTSALGSVTSVAIHPLNPLIAFAGTTQNGVYLTTDGGVTWAQTNPGLPNTVPLPQINIIAIDEAAPAAAPTVYLGFNNNGVYKRSFGPVPNVSLSSIDFGTKLSGSYTVIPVTLSNSGNLPLQVSSIIISTAGPYFIVSNTCGATVNPGASCSFGVQFNPATAGGPYGNAVLIATNAPGSPLSIPLTALSTGSAPTKTWASPVSGNWSVAGNWIPAGVPAAGDVVAINQAGTYTVTLDANATVAGLTVGGASGVQTLDVPSATLTLNGPGSIDTNGIMSMTGGVVSGTGNLDISGALNWPVGASQMLGTGTTSILAAGTSTISGSSIAIIVRTFNNYGTINLSTTGWLSISGGVQFNNNQPGVLEVTSDAMITSTPFYGASGTFNNNLGAVFRKKTATGTTSIVNPFNNSGDVDVQSGIVSFGGGSTHGPGSTTKAAAGATVDFIGGANIFDPAAVYTVTGTTSISNAAASVTLDYPSATTGNLTVSAGTLQCGGALGVSGTFAWSGGTLQGAGALNLLTGSTSTWSGSGNLTVSTLNINNSGTVNLTNTASLLFQTNAIFNNNAPGVFSIQSNAPIGGSISESIVNNSGATLQKKTATGTTTINVLLSNNGIIDIQSGIINSVSNIILASTKFTINGTTVGTQYGQLQAGGITTLGGILNVTLGYAPAANSSFTVLTCVTACSGTFASTSLPALTGGKIWYVDYSSGTSVVLRVLAPMAITPAILSAWTAGQPGYSQTITATGGLAPYTFSISTGTLPTGLILTSGGVLSGTPAVAATSAFTVKVMDTAGNQALRNYSLTVNPFPTVTTATLPGGSFGQSYNQTIVASGGTGALSFSLATGTLPGGLTLSAAGVLSGVPNTVGSFNFTVNATDTIGAISGMNYTVVINKVTPVITWPVPADIAFGTPLSAVQLNASTPLSGGTFVYSPPLGTVLGVGTGQVLTVTFTPALADQINYNGSSQSVVLNVLKANQVINFAPPGTVLASSPPIALVATGGGSGNPVTFSVLSGPGTLGGNTNSMLTITGLGTIVVMASQAGSNTYNAAPDITVSIVVTNNIYTVTAAASQGGAITPPSATVVSGSTASFTVTPDPGYAIASVTGCNGTLSGTTYTTGPITAACSVSATFAIMHYTVTASTGPNGRLDIATPSPVTLNYGSAASFNFIANIGYHVAAITDSCGGTGYVNNVNGVTNHSYTTPAITSNCTVSALFAIDQFQVAGAAETGGSISPGAITIPYGSTAAFSISADPTHMIIGVSGCGGTWSGANPYITAPVTAACTVTASFHNMQSDGVIVDAPGKVQPDISDALRALKISVGMEQATADDLLRGDVAPLVNGVPQPDNAITLGDAVVILRRALNLVAW